MKGERGKFPELLIASTFFASFVVVNRHSPSLNFPRNFKSASIPLHALINCNKSYLVFLLALMQIPNPLYIIGQTLQALDRDRDGFITKKEFQMMNKAMTPTQVNRKRNDFVLSMVR